ncbi:hypothetical protein GCM10022243_13320 [Saccharothrix violaceirubra]|uniref:Uncharacterized protein n=1 Tax=Saccharothrix violaceirubra TaxID=413306 RepID=A0A7W7T6R8_9PSEU|nr:hypothetical protein [Saccharothrix violaceirubra]MBB4967570.1 hypothetical protein [Saccharothrix violaceirubra]
MSRILRWHPPLMIFTFLMLGFTAVSAVGLVVDDRVLLDAPIWFKPFKFAISLALYGVTFAWILTFVTRFKRLARWAGTLIAVGGTLEMLIITGQVVRGRQSHFNESTPLDDALWDTMAYAILGVWVMHLIISLVLAFTRFEDRVAGLAIRLGSFLALIGLALGILMARNIDPDQVSATGIAGSHTIGRPDSTTTELAVTGWNANAGDLRVPHFVGIHALQLIPLIVVLFGRRANRTLVWGLSIGYAGLMVLTTWQALRGQAPFQPDGQTTVGALVLVAWSGLVTVVALLLNSRRTARVAVAA